MTHLKVRVLVLHDFSDFSFVLLCMSSCRN